MGARLSGHLNACFLSFDLMDLVIRLGSCTASWYCAIRMLPVTLEARTAMFLCACAIGCLPASRKSFAMASLLLPVSSAFGFLC